MLSTGLIQIALYYPYRYSSKQFHKIYSILVTSGPLHLGKSSASGRGALSQTHPTRHLWHSDQVQFHDLALPSKRLLTPVIDHETKEIPKPKGLRLKGRLVL